MKVTATGSRSTDAMATASADRARVERPGIQSATSPTVAIYSDRILPFSQTFVAGQAAALERFTPLVIGLLRESSGIALVDGLALELQQDRTRMPRLWADAFRLTGVPHPTWYKRIRSYSPALIHAHFGPSGVRAIPLARKLDVPLVTTFHGFDMTVCGRDIGAAGFGYRHYVRRLPELFEQATACVAVSQYAAIKLIEKGCPPEKVFVHYVGVDVDQFAPGPTVDREPIVLFVGRLEKIKGCEVLVNAMKIVQKNIPEAQVVVIGDGPMRSVIEQAVADGHGRWRYLGAQPPAVVRDWMRKASVLCAPGVRRACGCGEAFGLAYAEAQASGLPVVGFAQGGITEAVAHGQTGLLAREGNVAELAGYVIDLLGNEGARVALGNVGRQRVERKFNLRRNTRVLEDLYYKWTGPA